MGQMGLYYSTSTDGGLTFSTENKIIFPAPLANSFGNDPDVFLDKDGSMILWAGGFDNALGGYIGAVKLTKGTASSGESQSPQSARQKSKNVKFTCTKGKQKVTKTGVPVCPPGWKLLK
jgi:beta-xylosidase